MRKNNIEKLFNVSTTDKPVDVLTKALLKDKFELCRGMMNLCKGLVC